MDSAHFGWGRLARHAVMAAALMLLAGFQASPTRAAYDPTLEVRVAEAVAAGQIDVALAIIDRALADTPTPAEKEDLTARRADILAQAGRTAEAAAAHADLAALIGARTGDRAPELLPIWERAAGLFEAAGDTDRAIEAYAQAVAIAAAANLSEGTETIQEKLDVLVELAPDGDIADAALDALQDYDDMLQRLADRQSGGATREVDPAKAYKEVKIYYATDRARSGKTLPSQFYGGERGALELGTATVTIPLAHRPGQIEEPSIWSFEFREDPQRHIVLSSVTPHADAEVFAEMRQHMDGTTEKEAFVFVHGFNVPFHEAAKRTAQMAYDMNFDGLPILYSWPSRASIMSYIADTAVVNFSGRRLTLFLEDLVRESGAKRIHLIAHSMGNRALTDALELYALRNAGKPAAFDQVLFTAPDLDAGLFAEMMRTIRPVASRITLYASNRDWALAVSRRLHGDAPRAGQGGEDILRLAEVDSIDMTSIGEDMLAHSYYANNPSALTDILSLFWRDAAPDQRCGMTPNETEAGTYWSYAPDDCDGAALLSTLSLLRRGSVGTVSEARNFMNRFILSAKVDREERGRLEGALRRLFGGAALAR